LVGAVKGEGKKEGSAFHLSRRKRQLAETYYVSEKYVKTETGR
jgi:hypothetical protein